MAEPDRNPGASASPILNNSTQSNISSDTFYRQTEGIDFTGFTCNTNLPLHDWLADSKRKHDAVREHALSVLDIEKKKHELQMERTKKDRIKAEARLAHKIKTERIKLQKYEKILEAERLAKANDLAAAEAAIVEQQQARSNSPPQQQPYKPKKLEQRQLDEIAAGFTVMEQHLKRQVHALVLKEHPEYPYDEDFGMEIDPSALSTETLSKIHDIVQRHFPDLISAPDAIEAPAAEQAAPVAQQITPQQPATPVGRSASPQRTSPRNHRGLGLDLQPSRPAPSALPAAAKARDSSLAILAARLEIIHQDLKDFRIAVGEMSSASREIKAAFGWIRRTVQGRLNVISKDRTSNNAAKTIIVNVLRDALRPNCGMDGTFHIPECDVNQFLITPRQALVPEPAVGLNADNLPVTFIYAIHMLAKMTIKKFVEECSSDPSKADLVGLMISSIFAMPEFQYRGESLIDILLAKFRHDCPVLFGIRGSEKTEQGRARLGWRRQNDGWIDVQTHSQRMTGLAAGFSSIALRDYSKSVTMDTPWGPEHWWNAVAAIVDTPIAEASDTQFTVLKYMIERWEDKIFCLWGDKGRLSLLSSIRLFPGHMGAKTGAVFGLDAMFETMTKKWGFPTIGAAPLGDAPAKLGVGFGIEVRSPLTRIDPAKSPVWGPFSPMHGLVVGDARLALKTPMFSHWSAAAQPSSASGSAWDPDA